MKEICRGLKFPEGPIAMIDGSVILVEIERGTLSRVSPNGQISVIAECGGGPNGAAMGPDGRSMCAITVDLNGSSKARSDAPVMGSRPVTSVEASRQSTSLPGKSIPYTPSATGYR